MNIEKAFLTFIVGMVIFMLFIYYVMISRSSVSAKSVEITTKTFTTPELEIHSKDGVLDTTYIYKFKN